MTDVLPILIIASNSHRNTLPSISIIGDVPTHMDSYGFRHFLTSFNISRYVYIHIYMCKTIYTYIIHKLKYVHPCYKCIYIYIDTDRSANIDLQSSADYLHRLLLHAPAKPIPFQLLLCEDIAALFNQVPRFLLFRGLGERGVCVPPTTLGCCEAVPKASAVCWNHQLIHLRQTLLLPTLRQRALAGGVAHDR